MDGDGAMRRMALQTFSWLRILPAPASRPITSTLVARPIRPRGITASDWCRRGGYAQGIDPPRWEELTTRSQPVSAGAVVVQSSSHAVAGPYKTHPRNRRYWLYRRPVVGGTGGQELSRTLSRAAAGTSAPTRAGWRGSDCRRRVRCEITGHRTGGSSGRVLPRPLAGIDRRPPLPRP